MYSDLTLRLHSCRLQEGGMEEGGGRGAPPVPWGRAGAAVSSIFRKEVLAYTDNTQRRLLSEKPQQSPQKNQKRNCGLFSNLRIIIVNVLFILSNWWLKIDIMW